ncbi:MAG: hypothetical protein ACHQ01_01765 [Candidatus Limnocylindrales bacterium]
MAAPFVAALEAAYPRRFGDKSLFPFKDPTGYAQAYLRGVIAYSSVNDHPVAYNSWAATAMLRELDRVISLDGQEFACVSVLSDVDFQAVHDADLGAIRLCGRGDRIHFVSQTLPEALWADDHGYPLPGEHPQGLLVGRAIGELDAWRATPPITAAMDRFVYALRLGTAVTTHTRKVWSGETSMIHVNVPSAHEPQEVFGLESRWRRRIALEPEHLPGLRRLMKVIEVLEPDLSTDKPKPVPSVLLAIWRYTRSLREAASWQDSVLDLATALEACLGPASKEEIGLCLRTRAAHLLAFDDSAQADAIYTDIQDLYTLRSNIIHGNTRLKPDLPSLWKARGYEHVSETDRLHVLLDRWQDIVRRAIAVRLALADDAVGSPLWPLTGDEPNVDKMLVRRDARREWHERILAVSESFGLPCLTEKALPLWDYLHFKQGPPPAAMGGSRQE